MFRDFLVHTEMEVNPQERDPFYLRLTDAYVAWQKHPKAVDHRRQAERALHAGRRDVIEGAPHDRSQQPGQQHLVHAGIHARHQRVGPAAPWIYRGGIYSSGAMNREFGRFNGDMFTLGAGRLRLRQEARRPGSGADRRTTCISTRCRTTPSRNGSSTSRRCISGSRSRSWGMRTDLSKTAGYLGQRDILWA